MSEEPKKPFEKIAGIAENASALQKLTHALGRAVEIIMEYPPGSSPIMNLTIFSKVEADLLGMDLSALENDAQKQNILRAAIVSGVQEMIAQGEWEIDDVNKFAQQIFDETMIFYTNPESH